MREPRSYRPPTEGYTDVALLGSGQAINRQGQRRGRPARRATRRVTDDDRGLPGRGDSRHPSNSYTVARTAFSYKTARRTTTVR